MHYYSSTALFCTLLITVFGVHLLERKVAVFVFESTIVHGKKLAEYLALYLLNKVIDGISIDKRSLFGIMSMKIEIERQSIILCKVFG